MEAMTTLNSVGISSESRSDLTVAEAVGRWLHHAEHRRGRQPSTMTSYVSTMRAFLPWVGHVDISAVNRLELEAFIDRPHERVSRAKPATVKREVSTLRAFFQWAEDEGLVERSPARGMHAPTVHNIQPKPIPDEVWQAWWFHDMPDSLRVALGLGFFAGLRRAEITSLTTYQVTEDAVVDVKRKGGSTHTVPWRDMVRVLERTHNHLVGAQALLWPAVRRLQEGRGGHRLLLWASPVPAEMNKRLERWGRQNDLTRFTPHQLRHSTATNLLRAGTPLHLVSALLNHSNPAITMRYVAAGASQLAEHLRMQG